LLKLPVDFLLQTLMCARPKEIPNTCPQGLRSIKKIEVQADTQLRITSRYSNSFIRGGPVNHQASLRYQSSSMIPLDGFVNFVGRAKIVAGDDQMFRLKGHSLLCYENAVRSLFARSIFRASECLAILARPE
jgi:hypothetical protein